MRGTRSHVSQVASNLHVVKDDPELWSLLFPPPGAGVTGVHYSVAL